VNSPLFSNILVCVCVQFDLSTLGSPHLELGIYRDGLVGWDLGFKVFVEGCPYTPLSSPLVPIFYCVANES
jgi:hypothetical protein